MDIAKAIEVLSEKIGVSVKEMLPHFTTYYFWASVAWLVCGVLMCGIAGFLFKIGYRYLKSQDRCERSHSTPWFIISAILAVLGGLCVVANIPGIIAPTAEGYYYLLKAIGNVFRKGC